MLRNRVSPSSPCGVGTLNAMDRVVGNARPRPPVPPRKPPVRNADDGSWQNWREAAGMSTHFEPHEAGHLVGATGRAFAAAQRVAGLSGYETGDLPLRRMPPDHPGLYVRTAEYAENPVGAASIYREGAREHDARAGERWTTRALGVAYKDSARMHREAADEALVADPTPHLQHPGGQLYGATFSAHETSRRAFAGETSHAEAALHHHIASDLAQDYGDQLRAAHHFYHKALHEHLAREQAGPTGNRRPVRNSEDPHVTTARLLGAGERASAATDRADDLSAGRPVEYGRAQLQHSVAEAESARQRGDYAAAVTHHESAAGWHEAEAIRTPWPYTTSEWRDPHHTARDAHREAAAEARVMDPTPHADYPVSAAAHLATTHAEIGAGGEYNGYGINPRNGILHTIVDSVESAKEIGGPNTAKHAAAMHAAAAFEHAKAADDAAEEYRPGEWANGNPARELHHRYWEAHHNAVAAAAQARYEELSKK